MRYPIQWPKQFGHSDLVILIFIVGEIYCGYRKINK